VQKYSFFRIPPNISLIILTSVRQNQNYCQFKSVGNLDVKGSRKAVREDFHQDFNQGFSLDLALFAKAHQAVQVPSAADLFDVLKELATETRFIFPQNIFV